MLSCTQQSRVQLDCGFPYYGRRRGRRDDTGSTHFNLIRRSVKKEFENYVRNHTSDSAFCSIRLFQLFRINREML